MSKYFSILQGCDVRHGQWEERVPLNFDTHDQKKHNSRRLDDNFVFEIPTLHTLRRNPAVSREIVRKWRPPVEADDRIVGDLRAALVSLAVVVQA